jgi:coproporphyrinogen III oxidase-like Fe-S oxidoreductase
MNTIASSQKNRRERIADAMRIEWKGFVDTYSVDLWIHLNDCLQHIREYGPYSGREIAQIYFGGSKHTLTLTDLENLCGLVRRSYHAQQEAKAARQ